MATPKKLPDEQSEEPTKGSINEASEKDDKAIDKEEIPITDWKLSVPDEDVRITFVNGNSYVGRISRQKMEGQGLYRWSNGSQYKGEFEDNKIQGKGKLEWQDCGWYEGDFQDGHRHGTGTMVDKNYNLLYIGQWHKGHKHGKGYCRYEGGDSYDGDWIMDKREGVGTRVYPSGARYVGHWENGLRHGIGTMAWPNGDLYRGEWKQGKPHGYGEYTWHGFFNKALCWPQEVSYMGGWHEGTRNGKGKTIERLLFIKEGLSLHFQRKVRFGEYFEYFPMGQNLKKINHSEGAKNIDFAKKIRKLNKNVKRFVCIWMNRRINFGYKRS